MLAKLVLGLGIGVIFGFALQRGRFCMYTAFRDIFLIRDLTLFKAYVLAVLIQMVLIHVLRELGVINFGPVLLFWLGAMIGGFLFGIGMTLAGGCASSSFYRVGEGMIGSFVAVLTFIIFAASTSVGILKPLAVALYSVNLDFGARSATISGLVGINDWIIVVLLVIVGGFWLFWGRSPTPERGWGWHKTGIIIGLIAAMAWWASSITGRNYGLTMTGPSASVLLYLTRGDNAYLDWGTFQLLGIPLGAFLAASWNREFRWRAPQPKRIMLQALGGAVMGIRAVIAM
nr:YeeE/YedE family protein [Deltaproteobacteria bacterium]